MISPQGLRSNWSLVNQTYQGLSLLTDTLYKRQKRAKVSILIANDGVRSIHILGGESVEPVGEVHPDVGGPHHHLHHRQPLPPLLAKYALFRNPTVSNRYRTEPRTVFRMNKFLVHSEREQVVSSKVHTLFAAMRLN